METQSSKVIILMPNDSHLEVTYYCTDARLKESEKEKLTQLFIQLHDCICTMKIDRSICRKRSELEHLVYNKVISEKGHLC